MHDSTCLEIKTKILSQILWPSLNKLKEISGLLVDLAVLFGALAAIVKFRLFNMLGHRWRSELACAHYDLPDSSVIFTADYTIHNTGQRPILVTEVSITLTGARQEGSLLLPDENQKYATRVMGSEDPALKGLFRIEPGERTIFTLRTKLPTLEEAVFVLCDFSVSYKRAPASYRGFYVNFLRRESLMDISGRLTTACNHPPAKSALADQAEAMPSVLASSRLGWTGLFDSAQGGSDPALYLHVPIMGLSIIA